MKKVAIIQNGDFFTPDLQDKYLENITLFHSDDVQEVYSFIIKKARKDIFKFVLNITSGLLEELMDYVTLKKKSKNFPTILKKCTFVATRSNADNIRNKKNLKDMNLYFTLTPIGEILKNYSDNRIFIVSNNTSNPFFNQIYTFKSNNYRISELTVDILNNYKGHAMTCALNSEDEYKKYVELILKSNYRKIVQFIEVNYLGILKPLGDIMFSFGNINAGSGLVGNMLEYPELNELEVYNNTSLMLAYHHNQWDSFIKNKIISRRNVNYGKLITYLNTNDFK